jgi:hypothetical protein
MDALHRTVVWVVMGIVCHKKIGQHRRSDDSSTTHNLPNPNPRDVLEPPIWTARSTSAPPRETL